MFKLTITVATLEALITLAEVLQDNGFDADDSPAKTAEAPQPAAATDEKPKRGRKPRETAAAPVNVFAPPGGPAVGLTDAELAEPVAPALAALAGVPAAPQPPAAAPAPPVAPAPPASPAATPAGLVDPAAYVAPAALTLEHLQSAMAGLLANGRSASQAQAFLLENTGFKALKDLPPEWYPRAHWCLATGQNAG